MMAWAEGKQLSETPSMDVHDQPCQPHAKSEGGGGGVPSPEEEEEVEEAVDVLGGREISIETFDDDDEDDDDESSYRVSSIDEACASKTESSCPSSADSLGLDPLGLRRSLSPRHHPLLSPMHMGKAGGSYPPRQVSPARSDAGVSSRAGCKRSVSSAVNGKELLSLPPSHSLPVSPLLHRKFFSGRSPQRSFSHSRMVAGRSLTRLSEGGGHAVVTIAAPHACCPEEEDEQRRRMRDILQNLPLAEIYKKRARRNNSRERATMGIGSCSTLPSGSDSTPAGESVSSVGAQSTMEVFIHTPSQQQETPPLSASSSGRHNFKKALRDRYLLSQSYRSGGSGGGSSSSQDSAASGGRLPLDLTSERFTKIREPLKSETEDLISPHLMLTDDTNPNSPMEPAIIHGAQSANIPSILHHPPPHSIPPGAAVRQQHPLHLSSVGGSLGDDDAFYPTTPAPVSAPGAGGQSAVAAAMAAAVACNIDPVQLIARTCRIESSSSSFLSADMDSDPFSPMSPMSPCLISPKQQLQVSTSSGHLLTPPVTSAPGGSHHILQPAAPTSGPWIQPPSVPSIGVPRGGAPFLGAGPGPPGCSGAMHPGAIPIQRQCQSAPQTPHSSPQIRSHFFFPPHSSQMPPPAPAILQPAAVSSMSQESVKSGLATVSSALSSPGLSPGGGEGRPGEAGARVSHACPVCSRSFSRSDMLSRHMRLHTGLKPYECASCGQSFSRSDHLNTHIRTHTGEKPYHCPQCSYSACRRDMITRHMKVHRRKLASGGSAASASPPPMSGGGGSSHSIGGEGPTTVDRGGDVPPTGRPG